LWETAWQRIQALGAGRTGAAMRTIRTRDTLAGRRAHLLRSNFARTKLNYQSIGSGGGIQQIKAKTVTFGASDAPLPGAELEREALVRFPMVMGGIVPVLNVAGVAPGELVLDGPTLAKIFLGEIKAWNDPGIAKLNPNAKLPSQAIWSFIARKVRAPRSTSPIIWAR